MTLRQILEAIRELPRPDRLRLMEQLATEVGSEPRREAPLDPPSDANWELRSGFYVYTGPVEDPSVLDHRIVREERIERLARATDLA